VACYGDAIRRDERVDRQVYFAKQGQWGRVSYSSLGRCLWQ
jgi:hypothetical protein